MGKYTKWIVGGLGWALGGPIGGLLGFAAGSLFDTQAERFNDRPTGQSGTQGDFVISLLVLTAAVMKADGKILKSELDYVKAYFKNVFGTSKSGEVIKMLGELIKQEIPVRDVCAQISHNMDYSSQLQFMHFLFGISQADGNISLSELNLLSDIANHLSITQSEFESIKSMFIKNNTGAYKILEIEPTATDDEVKKAYRKMAVKFHPDKVSYLGEEIQNNAKVKFQQLSDAYEQIKKERNIS